MKKFGLLLLAMMEFAAFGMPAEILIIRHAEKIDDTHNDLSPKGVERAKALVGYFVKRSPSISAIYAMDPKYNTGSIRPIQTVEPLAKKLGLRVRHPFRKKQASELANEIKKDPQYDGKTVLISWQHSYIKEIVKAFGQKNAPDWNGNVFDRVWVLKMKGEKVESFSDLPQNVLPGDSVQ